MGKLWVELKLYVLPCLSQDFAAASGNPEGYNEWFSTTEVRELAERINCEIPIPRRGDLFWSP